MPCEADVLVSVVFEDGIPKAAKKHELDPSSEVELLLDL